MNGSESSASAALDEWLALAPSPAPLPAGFEWHVFLSYRSSDRHWALALYDVLTQLGYAVFLDQFVLNAGAALPSSLERHLERSQSGVLVWSSRTEDSAWCQREYNAFVTLQDERGFQFVCAQLNDVKLPLFARSSIWVDFAQQQEGPRGTPLLQLLSGLKGEPLPAKAVRLSAEIDDETRKALARLKVLTDAQDCSEILALARSNNLAWRSGPLLSCAAAESLISIRQEKAALEVLDAAGAKFPRSLRPRQLRGLALARSGQWKDARAALGELYELGQRDAETIGIYARTWMDAFGVTGDTLCLRRSRDLYAEGFAASPQSSYLGINAAAKSVFLNELDAGRDFALRVESLVGTAAKAGDYWHTATVAEAQLILGRFQAAAALYVQAVAMSPGRTGDHASTCKQARRLVEHLGAAAPERSLVLCAFRRVIEFADAATAIAAVRSNEQSIITFTGFSGSGYEDLEAVERIMVDELARLDPHTTTICAGGTPQGIGHVYPIAKRKGFRTIGVVSSQALSQVIPFSDDVDVVYVVRDATWGGRHGSRLTPASEAMVGCTNRFIAIGGGQIARDELEVARSLSIPITFHPADMNHDAAREQALASGAPAAEDYRGEVYHLMREQDCKLEGSK